MTPPVIDLRPIARPPKPIGAVAVRPTSACPDAKPVHRALTPPPASIIRPAPRIGLSTSWPCDSVRFCERHPFRSGGARDRPSSVSDHDHRLNRAHHGGVQPAAPHVPKPADLAQRAVRVRTASVSPQSAQGDHSPIMSRRDPGSRWQTEREFPQQNGNRAASHQGPARLKCSQQ